MRSLALLTLPLLLQAQRPPNRTPIPAGTTQRIVLQIAKAPIPGDAIYFEISTKRLTIALVTPSGARITDARTAEDAGLDWGGIDVTPPIGSDDAGAIGSMHFTRAGAAAGTYTVEFTAPAGVRNAWASATFETAQDKYLASMSHAPGFQKFGPLQLTPGQNPLEIVLDQDEKSAIFDLLASEGAQFSLQLPDGQTIDQSVGQQGKIIWKTATRDKVDPPGAWFGLSGFLLPEPGVHHVVTFENASKGKYRSEP